MTRNSSFQAAAKNTSLLSAGLFLGRFLAFFIFRRLANIEGPAGIGVWGVAVELTAIFIIAANFGLGSLVTREVIKEPARISSLFWSSLRIRLVAGTIGYAFLVGFVFLSGYDDFTRWAVLVMALGVFLEASAMACDSLLQAEERFQVQTLSQITSALVYFGLGILWLNRGGGLEEVIWANVISRGVRLVLVAASVAPSLIRESGTDAPAPIGSTGLVRMAWPIFLSSTLGVIAFKIDTVMVMQFLGEEGAGIYTAGRRPLDLLVMIPTLFAVAIFPTLQRQHGSSAHDLSALRNWASRALLYLYLAVLPITLFCLVSAEMLVQLLTGGGSFAEAVAVLRWAVLGLPLMVFMNMGNRLLLVVGQERKFVRISLMVLLVIVGLNLFLIPTMGAVGAALSLVIGLLTGCVQYQRDLLRADLAPPLGRGFAAGATAQVGAWAMTVLILGNLRPDWGLEWTSVSFCGLVPSAVTWGLAGLFYFLLLILFRVVGPADLDEWRGRPR
ncbi:MAG: flippase [Gemmatimonadales bacterium]|nr:flippase [Gemmatimonadales bacterium]